jgi:hypothetical protein
MSIFSEQCMTCAHVQRTRAGEDTGYICLNIEFVGERCITSANPKNDCKFFEHNVTESDQRPRTLVMLHSERKTNEFIPSKV